ncbi:MAG: hypothetical protein ACYDA1_04840 [Vulcanimicrobiaceae bacterium]
MKARDRGENNAESTIRDVLRGDDAATANDTDVIATRVPMALAQRVRDEASRRGLTISEIVEEYICGHVQRVRSASAVDARPWTAVGYRLSRALDAIQSADLDTAKMNITDAKKLVTIELMALRDGYDSDLDRLDTHSDDWSGKP